MRNSWQKMISISLLLVKKCNMYLAIKAKEWVIGKNMEKGVNRKKIGHCSRKVYLD